MAGRGDNNLGGNHFMLVKLGGVKLYTTGQFKNIKGVRSVTQIVEDGTGRRFRTYESDIDEQGRYRSILGPGMDAQRSCPHKRIEGDSVESVVLHGTHIGGDHIKLPTVLVLQGEFEGVDPDSFWYPRTDILLDPKSDVLLRAFYEHYKYPSKDLLGYSHDQNVFTCFQTGVDKLFFPHVHATLEYFLAKEGVFSKGVAASFNIDNSTPIDHENDASTLKSNPLNNPKITIERLDEYLINKRTDKAMNLMEARRIFGITRITLDAINQMIILVKKVSFLVHPDRNPSMTNAQAKFVALREAAGLIMEEVTKAPTF